MQRRARELEREAADGRAFAHFERRSELNDALRAAYAGRSAAEAADVALTTCTTEGMAQTIGGLALGAGDEILTSDEEHPGLLGALGAARELRGVAIREVPLPEIAEAVGPAHAPRRLLARRLDERLLAPAELARARRARAARRRAGRRRGARRRARARLRRLRRAPGRSGCADPTAPGMLYVSAALRERLEVSRRGYGNLADPNGGLDARLHEDARRFDTLSLSAEAVACALAAAELLECGRLGARCTSARARSPRRLAERLAERGRELAPRGRHDARLLRQRRPRSRARAAGRARRASCATSPAGRGCARRSAPGTTRATSSACSTSLAADERPPQTAHAAGQRCRHAREQRRAARARALRAVRARLHHARAGRRARAVGRR